jgi:transcriptional regulator GlxA family with amidase domain
MRIAIVIYPGVQAIDVTGPAEVFGEAARQLGGTIDRYQLQIVAPRAVRVRTASGLRLQADSALTDLNGAIDTLLVPGGRAAVAMGPSDPLVAWLSREAPKARRYASVCTGAFLLAAAGLLAGRRATTHWRYAAALRTRYPTVSIEPDAIVLRDGPVWTSGGSTAGIDLALALVEEDYGAALARAVARRLVTFLRRPGGQMQFAVTAVRRPSLMSGYADALARANGAAPSSRKAARRDPSGRRRSTSREDDG